MRARLALALVLALLLVGCGDEVGFFSTLTTATTSAPTASTTGAPATTTTTAAETTTTTVPPVGEWTWSPVALGASAFGGTPDTQALMWVTAGGPGLVAVGAEYTEAEGDVAVWTSLDGRAWSRVPHDESVFGGEGLQYPLGGAAGGPGLVAVGVDEAGGDPDAAVWTSPDGLVWARVPHDEAVFGGNDLQTMTSVTTGGPGLVAVGADGSGGDWVLAVWTSPDGLNWERLPLNGAALGGSSGQRAERVVAWSGGLVAVGEAICEEGYCAAVWTSVDGIAWTRTPHDESVFGGPETQAMEAVAVGGPGLVAVGFDGSGGDFDAAVWTSVDGVAWARVPHDEAVFGGEHVQAMSDVVAVGGGFVAVGRDDSPAGVSLAVWTSPDGLTWTRVPHDPAVFGSDAEVLSVAAAVGGPGVVVVDGAGEVWVAAPDG